MGGGGWNKNATVENPEVENVAPECTGGKRGSGISVLRASKALRPHHHIIHMSSKRQFLFHDIFPEMYLFFFYKSLSSSLRQSAAGKWVGVIHAQCVVSYINFLTSNQLNILIPTIVLTLQQAFSRLAFRLPK